MYFSANQGIPDTKNSDTTQLKMWPSRLYGMPPIVDSTDAHLAFKLRNLSQQIREPLLVCLLPSAIPNSIIVGLRS